MTLRSQPNTQAWRNAAALKHFERSEAVERLERLERLIDPGGFVLTGLNLPYPAKSIDLKNAIIASVTPRHDTETQRDLA